MIWAKFKRLFTHPYGPCTMEGCDNPRRDRWADFCEEHIYYRLQEAAKRQARSEFDRQADIVAEGIRRAKRR